MALQVLLLQQMSGSHVLGRGHVENPKRGRALHFTAIREFQVTEDQAKLSPLADLITIFFIFLFKLLSQKK